MKPPFATAHPGESLRFFVNVGDESVAAYITQTSWRAARHEQAQPEADTFEPALLDTYRAHQDQIDRAVLRRLAAGARAPVVLRAADL
jgi:hypothetical protein